MVRVDVSECQSIAAVIEGSDAWKADLLALADHHIAIAVVSAAELVYPECRYAVIRSLMPPLLRWRRAPGVITHREVVASIYRYCYQSGLFQAGGSQFLKLPVSRWLVQLEDNHRTAAEDCVLEAANAVAMIGDSAFFAVATNCLSLAQDAVEHSQDDAVPFQQRLSDKIRIVALKLDGE